MVYIQTSKKDPNYQSTKNQNEKQTGPNGYVMFLQKATCHFYYQFQ